MGRVTLLVRLSSEWLPCLCSEELSSSHWQCYLVEWGDNKDTDRLSPWDMEPLHDGTSGGSDDEGGGDDSGT